MENLQSQIMMCNFKNEFHKKIIEKMMEAEKNKPQEIEGYLEKYSPSIFTGWQNRYFTLKNRKLKYFKDKNSKNPKGCFNFDFMTVDIKVSNDYPNEFRLTILGNDRNFDFRAKDEQTAKKWIYEIKNHIKSSNGHSTQLRVDVKEPWRFDMLSENQFLESADTGDILLFKGSKAVQKTIRTLTNSRFDHVAMILKFDGEPNEVYFVEATGNMGVALNKWEYLRDHIGNGKFYSTVAFRHVNFKRDNNMCDNLEKLLDEAIGRNYGMNPSKLMRSKTIKSRDNTLIAEDRTFFCSELVAKAFKILGVLKDDDTSCTQFYPHHFTGAGDSFLKLENGVTIDTQQMILMDGFSNDIEESFALL